MALSFCNTLVVTVLLCGGVSACSNSDFSGGSASNYTKKIVKPKPSDPVPVPVPGPSGGPGDGTPANPNGLDVDSNGNAIIRPKSCDKKSLVQVGPAGKCPDGHGIFGIDDPGSGTPLGTVACCPLPASDILKGAEVARSGTCGANEILIGHSGLQVLCRGINTASYKLVPAKVCYFGSGASGQGNAQKCSNFGPLPPTFSPIYSGMMGSDGCLNYPWGSLSVAQFGQKCSDQSSMTLQKSDGTPVQMFK